ncbi:HK97-gp10 family putative phage morphogenesis protein [Alicyclobacillus contaminans]|uniref:HK97-gp10 family putative phage morphogenesis protein n=1 Tax=Alicyclobacillus contaminans TaxID=392016 RepID=UPI00040B8FCC|nr:HK97-gp10 family putative phage morphogenesis protein [Alicyclobacillus contaminans]
MSIDGMEALLARLNGLGDRAARVQNQALRAAGNLVAEAMRENVPVSNVEHLHIRDDIQVSRVKVSADGVRSVDVGPGPKTGWRAKFLEFGTSKMQAQPFVERSLIEKRRDALDVIAETVRAALK